MCHPAIMANYMNHCRLSFVMEHLFIVRHAEWDMQNMRAQFLTEKGRGQAELCARYMMRVLGSSPDLYVATSPEMRTVRTAHEIADILGMPDGRFPQHDALLPNDGNPLDPARIASIDALIGKNKDSHALLLVTHEEVASAYPSLYTHRQFGITPSYGTISNGQGVHIDLTKRKYVLIPLEV